MESPTTDGQGLEELGDGLPTGLGIASSARRRALGRREVGDALGGLDGNVGPGHGEMGLNRKVMDQFAGYTGPL